MPKSLMVWIAPFFPLWTLYHFWC